jgi:hypothetical protein
MNEETAKLNMHIDMELSGTKNIKIYVKNSKILLNLREIFTLMNFTLMDDTVALLNIMDKKYLPSPMNIYIYILNSLIPV